ncbi:MAG TPA: sugar transferase [Bacteroidales bacterium]|nr:sugar transferase [Bacteroidales bacterium]HSA43540.1 sugar transferase [Bacteroidales bacterium]
MLKRCFDVVFSLGMLLLLSPLFLLIMLLLLFASGWRIFFSQIRVGLDGKTFRLLKFRTMKEGSEAAGQLTVGGRDPRITLAGSLLRKYKLDELPQLVNVLKGEMSLVGPRPEVPKYVALYTDEQRNVLQIRPGITDFASLEYIDESEILGRAGDPETLYCREIMPAKLAMNLKYLENQCFLLDLRIIMLTLWRVFFRR